MRKRFLIMICILMLLVSALFILSSCAIGEKNDPDTCSHEWGSWITKSEPTCEAQGTKERTCSVCQTVQTAQYGAVEHVGGTATCEKKAVCSVCNTEYGELLMHDYAEATCTAPKTCKVCSATDGYPVAHNGGIATCNALAICDGCGSEYGNYAEHVYDVKNTDLLYRISKATCTSSAVYYYSCACGEKGTTTFNYGTSLEHDYIFEANGNGTHTLICKNDSSHTKTEACSGGTATCIDKAECALCSEEYGEPHGHEWQLSAAAVDSQSSCESSSTVLYECTHCDATKTEIVAAKGHTYESVVTEPTCVEKGYTTHTCTACSKSYIDSEVVPTGKHTWNRDRDCENGHTCTVCGTSEASLGHSYKVTGYIPATCETAEFDVYTCSGCGDSYETVVGEALGHNLNGVSAVEVLVSGSSCEYEQYYKCKTCGEDIKEEQNVFHHNYTAAVTLEANCKTEGVKTYTCNCGDSYTEEIAIDGEHHVWNDGVLVGSVKTYTCTVEGCGKTKTVVVASESNKADNLNSDALAGSGVEFEDVTLDVSGLTGTGGSLAGKDDVSLSAGKLDSNTADDIKNSLTEEEKAQIGNKPIYEFSMTVGGQNVSQFVGGKVTVTIPYTPDENEDVDAIAIWFIGEDGTLESIEATYANGYVTFETDHFSTYTVTSLTPEQRCELYGHNYSKRVVSPTCTKEGYTLYICIRCSDTYKNEYVDPTGHSYHEVRTEPTCTKSGKIVYTCQNPGCRNSYQEKLPATGHTYVIETKEATCTEAGYQKGTCACGDEYTVVNPKLRHNVSFTVVDPTCEDDGYTLYECADCDYEYTDNITSATGHSPMGKWTWTEDHKSATITLTCALGCDFVHTETVTVTEKNVAPSCTKEGRVDYICKFVYNGETFSASYTEIIDTVDHVYGTDYRHDATGHSLVCINCAASGEKVSHSYGAGKVTKNATCKNEGERTFVCVCGEIKTESIAKTTDHKYSVNVCTVCGDVKECDHTFNAGVVTTEPTCITEGVKTYTCTICQHTKTESVAKVDVHVYNDGVVTTEPGCLTAGVKTYTCTLCAKTRTEPVAYLGGHNFEATLTTEPGCFTEGAMTSTCTKCGESKTESIPVIGSHSYGEGFVTRPAGCFSDGMKNYTCERCGNVKAEKIDAIGSHDFDDGIITMAPGCETEGVKTYTCKLCGQTENEAVDSFGSHAYGSPIVTLAPGCETEGTQISICTRCGDKKSETVASLGGHKYDSGVITTAPNCMEQGVKTFSCENCNVSYTETLEKTDHRYENGQDGVCLDCGISTECIHEYDNGKMTVRADCATEGVKTYTCKLCGGVETEIIPKTDVHNFNGGIIVTPPSCVTNGIKQFTCLRCGYIKGESIGNLGGHDYDDGVVTADPGCLTEGVKTYTCRRCDASYTEAIESLGGHLHSDGVVTKQPTCAAEGEITYTCERCGEVETDVLPKTDMHSYDDGEVTKKPDCTNEGVITYTCFNCGNTMTESIPTSDDHSYDDGVVTKAPTCIELGVKTYTCQHCGVTKTEDVPANDAHVFDEGKVTVKPNCAAEGVMTYTCTLCRETKTESIEKTDEHSYGDGVVTTAPTCKADGVMTYTCTVCQNTKTEAIEKTNDHSYGEGVVTTAPSCSAEGVMTYTCTVCQNTKTEAIEKTDDHSYGEGVETTKPGCVTNGVITYTCVACGATRTEKTDSLGGHSYSDGVCTVCGKVYTDSYYVNLVSSFKNITGFTVKIKNLSVEIRENGKSELIGTIKSVDIAALEIYVENDELCGSATGKVVIFNGPIADANAVYEFDASIKNGYVYIKLSYGSESAPERANVKMPVGVLIEELLGEMDVEAEAMDAVDFLADTLLPVIETLVEANKEDVEKIIENAFNIIFTFETREDKSVVATLDFDKLLSLNENLATKSVAEVVDLYFGEGSFDSIVEFALEILNLKVSEVPEYLDSKGIDSECLIAKINEFAKSTGAPDGYDIGEMIHSEELAGFTIGMLIFEAESADEVLKFINEEIVAALREVSLYELIEAPESMKDMVDSIIDMVSGVTVSFTTESDGMITDIDLSADGLSVEYEGATITVDAELNIGINDRIGDVTFDDIAPGIEDGIVMPEDDMLDDGISDYYDYWNMSGVLEYQGNKYQYNGIHIRSYQTLYDVISGIMFMDDCGGWTYYSVAYGERVCEFTICMVEADGQYLTFLVDNYTGQTVKLEESDNGIIVYYEDGTTKEVVIDFNSGSQSPDADDKYDKEYNDKYEAELGYGAATDGKDSIVYDAMRDMIRIYTELYAEAFADSEKNIRFFGGSIDYYYNALTGEFSTESHHVYEYDYVLSGNSCDQDGCTVITTCKNCDYRSERKRYGCDNEYEVEIDLSEYTSCGGTIIGDRCRICGVVSYIYDVRINCKMEGEVEEEIFDENGNVIGYKCTMTCTECGLEFVEQELIEDSGDCRYKETSGMYIYKSGDCIFRYEEYYWFEEHNYEYSYELFGDTCEDGYIFTTVCTKCDYRHSYEGRGHQVKEQVYELKQYGTCGGAVFAQVCEICKNVIYMRADYMCNMEKADKYEYEDENGFIHSVMSFECPDCNHRFVEDMYSGNEGCMSYDRNIYQIYSGEEIVFELVGSSVRYNHQYEYTYEFKGEMNCERGVRVIGTCKFCAATSEQYISWHNYELNRKEYNLAEYGICGGFLYTYECPCGERKRVEYSFDCRYEYSSDTYTDVNGIQHTVEHYNCANCSLNFTKDRYQTANGCAVEEYIVFSISVGENVIVSDFKVLNGRFYNHEYDITYEMHGKSCTDGVGIYQICNLCGEEQYYSIKGHEMLDVKEYTFSEYGACESHYFAIFSCPCGEQYYYKTDAERLAYNEELGAYVCDCGYSIIIDETNVTEGCTKISSITVRASIGEYSEVLYQREISGVSHSFTVGSVYEDESGKLVANIVCSVCDVIADRYADCYHGEMHRYTYLPEGSDSCDDGYYCVYFCTECGASGDVFMEYYHNSDTKSDYQFGKYGACDYHYFNSYGCACGLNSGWNSDMHNLQKENGYYVCYDCGLKYKWTSASEVVGCEKIVSETVTVEIGGTILNVYSETEAIAYHSFEYKEVIGESGEISLVGICQSCQLTHVERIYNEALTENEGQYYYEFEITPQVSGGYVVYSIGNDDTYVSLFVREGDELVFLRGENYGGYNGNFSIYCHLEAGRTYVYRVGMIGFSSPGRVSYVIASDSDCNHSTEEITFLANGAESCEDGYYRAYACTVCGTITGIELSYYHSTMSKEYFSLDEYGICEDHNIYVNECACGSSHGYEYDSYRLSYDGATDSYFCEACGYSVRTINKYEYDGCVRSELYSIEITVGGVSRVLYTFVNNTPVHTYETSITENGGLLVLTNTCSVCGDIYTVTEKVAELTENPENAGEFYYDLVVNTEKRTQYRIVSISGDVYFELCKVVGDELRHIYSEHGGMTYTLEANSSYVFRIRHSDSSNSDSINYLFFEYTSSCSHDYESFAILADGSKTCDDGMYWGEFCTSCGAFGSVYKYYYHQSVSKGEIKFEEYGACSYHYFSSYECPCGYENGYNYDSYNLNWDEENQRYCCNFCEYTFSTGKRTETEGCIVKDIRYADVTIGEYSETVYEAVTERVAHSYVPTVTVREDATYYVVSVCSVCGDSATYSEEAKIAELEYHEGEGYWYDLKVTVETSGEYLIYSTVKTGYTDTYVELYRVNGEELEYWSSEDYGGTNGNFRMSYYLESGETYVYRIRYWDINISENIPYVFKAPEVGNVCNHHSEEFRVFATEIKNCESGIHRGYICVSCGQITSIYTENSHNTTQVEHYELSELGACNGGYISVYECLCGVSKRVEYNYYCPSTREDTTVTDENGVEHNIETITCTEGCGLTIVRDYYRATEGCYTFNYCEYTVKIGETEILSGYKSVDLYSAEHDYSVEFILDGDDCNDGYTVIRTCKTCGVVNRSTGYGCSSYTVYRIDFDDYFESDSCGGYFYYNSCACGNSSYYGSNFNCSYSYNQEYKTDENGVGHNIETYSCTECGMVFTFDKYAGREGCDKVTYVTINLVYGEESVVTDYTFAASKTPDHLYEYEFTFNGEGESCEEGFTAYGTCADCGKTTEESYEYHHAFRMKKYDLKALGACGGYVEMYSCACGYEQSVDENFNCNGSEYSDSYTDDNGVYRYRYIYTCADCGLRKVNESYSIEDGCYTYHYCDYTVTVGEETIVPTYTYRSGLGTHHVYEYTFELKGTTCREGYDVKGVCKECGDVDEHYSSSYYHSTYLVERINLSEYGACGGYVDLMECPCGEKKSFSHSFDNCNYTTRTETVTGDNGIVHSLYYWYCEECNLEIIRDIYTIWEDCQDVTYYSYSVTVDYENVLSDFAWIYSTRTAHDYDVTIDLKGESCEDGYTVTKVCFYCEDTSISTYSYHQSFTEKRYDFKEFGACGNSYVELQKCPCGENVYYTASMYGCSYSSKTENQEKDGKVVTTYARWCDTCGLRIQDAYYTVADVENCMEYTYHTITMNVGTTAVDTFEYIVRKEAHSYEITAELMEGAQTCKDGVNVTYNCTVCDDGDYTTTDRYHTYYLNTSYEIDSTCGGYVVHSQCACGYYNTVSLSEMLCETNYSSANANPWVDNYIPSGWYYIGNSSYYISSNFYIYTCAVTDPACAYQYRYANYWALEDGCQAVRYICYQFGYDEATGTYDFEIKYKTTDSVRTHHSFVDTEISETTEDGLTVTGNLHTCSECGTYYYNKYYSDTKNNLREEYYFENNLVDNYNKSEKRVNEYSYDKDGNTYTSSQHYEVVYQDGNTYSEDWLYEYDYDYVAPYGTDSYRVIEQQLYNGAVSTYRERAYTVHETFGEVTVYTLDKYEVGTSYEHWDRYDYTYKVEGGCEITTVYTNNAGISETTVRSYHRYWENQIIKAPTCTQYGTGIDWCPTCETYISDEYEISPILHNWHYDYSDYDGYYCYNCGLENANGANGEVVMEDLTEAYGNGEYYVVGYYLDTKYQFTPRVSLMLLSGEAIVLENIETYEIEGLVAVAVSISEVEEAAQALGYTSEDFDVRISFVPDGADESHDYAITFG